MLIVLFSLSIVLLTFLICWYFIQQHIRTSSQIKKRIRNLHDVQEVKTTAAIEHKDIKDIPFVERVLKPAVRQLEHYVTRFTPKEIANIIQLRLVMAGKAHSWTVNQFCLTVLLATACMLLLMFTLMKNSNHLFVQMMMFILLGGAIGGFMPFSYLNILIEKRKAAIQTQLPEVLDLLCVSVQAGLSFDAALRKIVERMDGAFVHECKRLQDDIRMGMVRRIAMKNLAARCDVQDVSLFMTSLIQAERLGTSMGKTLKNQADNIRERRRQQVKAQALKAPVKMVIPLVLFIFPSIFVIALVPSLLSIMKNFIK